MSEATRSGRHPTLAEAVRWILKNDGPQMRDYRRRQLADWREKLGNEFADKVESEVRARWRSS